MVIIYLLLSLIISYGYPLLNPHINQTSNGTWSITAYKIGVTSVWYQDDLHKYLYLTAGEYNNIYYMDSFFFNESGHIEIIKTNKSTNFHHQYDCQYITTCDYDCEVDGYNESYLQYSGEFILLSPQFNNVSVVAYIGSALDALGFLPVIIYVSNATDNKNVALYRGMDILMDFGGLGRYFFPGDLYNVAPNYDVMINLTKQIGCPIFDKFVDNIDNEYNEPILNINQYKSMIGTGYYYDHRNNNIKTNVYYYINQQDKLLNLTIGVINGDYYRCYVYNSSLGIMYVGNNDNYTLINITYQQLIDGLNGMPTNIAYNGRYLVKNLSFIENMSDNILDIFSGTAMFFDGLIHPIIKYFDKSSNLLHGIDVIKPSKYKYSNTGYQRIWFTQLTAL